MSPATESSCSRNMLYGTWNCALNSCVSTHYRRYLDAKSVSLAHRVLHINNTGKDTGNRFGIILSFWTAREWDPDLAGAKGGRKVTNNHAELQ